MMDQEKLPSDYYKGSSRSEDYNMDSRKKPPAPSFRKGKWNHDNADTLGVEPPRPPSYDDSCFSPFKISRGAKLDELVAKRSPTSIFDLEDTQEASDKLSGFERSILQKFPVFEQSCTTLHASGTLYFDQSQEDESTVEAPVFDHEDPSISLFSGHSELASSIAEKAHAQTARATSQEFHNSWSTYEIKSADSAPRQPKRQEWSESPSKSNRRASFGSAGMPGIPCEIVCLPQDASPTKPSRQMSPNVRPSPLRKSCPGMTVLSLREALAMTRLDTDEDSLQDHSDHSQHHLAMKRLDTDEDSLGLQSDHRQQHYQERNKHHRAHSRCLSVDSLPTKPRRKFSHEGTEFDM